MALSRVQERIVGYIRRYLHQHGYAPSIRDIMAYCHFRSPRAVSFHLEKLQKAGVIRRDRKARSILPVEKDQLQTIPVLGTMPAAGSPQPAEQLAVHSTVAGRGGYALRVRGDSLQEARIFDGDIAIVEVRSPRTGDIVVALVDGRSCLKRLAKPKDEELKVQGVVVGIYRRIG